MGVGGADVLAGDTLGRLWLYTGNGNGLGVSNGEPWRDQFGEGFNGYTLTDGADLNGADLPDLLARDPAGVLWLYPLKYGNCPHAACPEFQPRIRIGGGWNSYTVRGPGDVSGDGRRVLLEVMSPFSR